MMLPCEAWRVTAAPTCKIRAAMMTLVAEELLHFGDSRRLALARHHNDVAISPEGGAPDARRLQRARERPNDLSMAGIRHARSCCLSRLALPSRWLASSRGPQ